MLIRYLAVTVAASSSRPSHRRSPQPSTSPPATSDYAALNATAALAEYKAAIAADSTAEEAYWKASRTLVDLGEYEPDKDKQKDLYAEAKDLATKAVAMKPTDPEAHF